jgi:ketosteroid isomerase-like protein
MTIDALSEPGAADEHRRALVQAWFDALRTGDIDGLGEVLAPDYRDLDPAPGQLPGAVGVTIKLLAFRAAFPDAVVVVETLTVTPWFVHAVWSTTATGLDGAPGPATSRFTARFEVDTRIRSSEVLSIEPR